MSDLVGIPEDRFSHVPAQMMSDLFRIIKKNVIHGYINPRKQAEGH